MTSSYTRHQSVSRGSSEKPESPRSDGTLPEFHPSAPIGVGVSTSLLTFAGAGSDVCPDPPSLHIPCEQHGLSDSPWSKQNWSQGNACGSEKEFCMEFIRVQLQKQEVILEKLLSMQTKSYLASFDPDMMSTEDDKMTLGLHDEEGTDKSSGDDKIQGDERESQSNRDDGDALQIKRERSSQRRLNTSGADADNHSRLRFVNSRYFDYTSIVAIIANVIIVGVEVDVTVPLPNDEIPQAFSILNLLFVCLFSAELVIKLGHAGCVRFFSGPDSKWNMFDAWIVFTSVAEVLVDAVVSSMNMSMTHLRNFRLLRLARILRALRVMRILTFVAPLRTLLHSVLSTIKSLAWTMLLLVMLFYAFGVALTQSVSDHCRLESIEATGDMNATPACNRTELSFYWGSLPESMLTLFMSVTGGVSWGECLHPLREISFVPVFAYLVFIVFTVLSLLNVVTGVFCHSAIQGATNDKEIATLIQLSNQKQYTATIKSMFSEIDDDDEDGITLDELEEALRDERFCAYLESIDISTSDAWTLFSLIDTDKSGSLDLDEFVSGCMQLRGPASAMQVAKLSMESGNSKRILKDLSRNISAIRCDMERQKMRLERIRS